MRIKDYLLNGLYLLGLTEKEALAYHALLKMPGQTILELSKRLKLSTAGSYKVVNSLMERGLIEITNDKRPFRFQATALEKIGRDLAKKSREWKRLSDRLKYYKAYSVLPEEAQVIPTEEVADFYVQIPSHIPDFLAFMGTYDAILHLPGVSAEYEFVHERVKRGIPTDGIMFAKTPLTEELETRNWKEKREFRYFEIPNYPREFTYIYGDHVASFFENAEGKTEVVHIESPELARSRLLQMQGLWNSTQE